jgi:hypothetical protein
MPTSTFRIVYAPYTAAIVGHTLMLMNKESNAVVWYSQLTLYCEQHSVTYQSSLIHPADLILRTAQCDISVV